jgi:four helix bundle protein
MDLAVPVLDLAEQLSEARLFRFSDQLQGAAISIPSNLAEGHGRRSRLEFAQFVGYANGSLRELETLLELVQRAKPKFREIAYRLRLRTDEIGRLLFALARALGDKKIKRGQRPSR